MVTFRNLLLSSLLIISSHTLHAQSQLPLRHEWKEQRSAGYTYKQVSFDPYQARYYTLKNGLTVILSPMHDEPRMHFYFAIKAGSKTDPATHTGLAHYLEHLMFKGTPRYGSVNWNLEKPLLEKINVLYETYNQTTDEETRKHIYHRIDSVSGLAAQFAIANEYDKLMTSMGVQGTNAFTSVEQTVYTEDVPANAVEKFLKVQAERFREPVFRIFHTELEAVYEEKNISLDNSAERAEEALLSGLFRNHPYGTQTTIGTVAHLKNPSLLEIHKYFDTYYVPNNMAIVVAGDFDPDVLIKRIDAYFSWMEERELPKFFVKPEPAIKEPIVKEITSPDAGFVTIGYRLPGIHASDELVASLIGTLLHNNHAGLMDLNLVKKQKMLSAVASSELMVDHGYLRLQGKPTKGQSLEEVRALLLAEIENLKNGNFDDELLVSVINNKKKENMQAVEKYSSRAFTLMYAYTTGEDWQKITATTQRLAKLTKKDITDFANKYFQNNYVVVYKRTGENDQVEKVDKPPISPIEPNADKQSTFTKAVVSMPVDPIDPVWIDYNQDIKRTNVGPAQLLYVQNKQNGLFRMAYRYKMGKWNDKKMAVAAQYLQFLGTDTKSSEEISRQFYKLACNFKLEAQNEYTIVKIEGLQENFERAITLFEDLLSQCKPDEAALAALKARLSQSRTDARNSKNAIMQSLVSYARYGANNPFNYTLSNEELEQLSSQELVEALHNLAQYSHSILYYGPSSMTAIAQSLKKSHRMPPMFQPVPAPVVFNFTEQSENQVLFADYDMVQSEIRWVRNIPGYTPAQQPVVDLFNSYFGGDMGSIVFQTIRESKALAYSTYAQLAAPEKKEDPYLLSAYVGCQADKLSEAMGSMNELLNKLPKLDNNLENARSQLKKGIETERITQDGLIYNYLAAERRGITEDIRKSIYQKATLLQFEDLKKLHAEYLANKPFTYCIVASEKKVSTSTLSTYGTVKKLSLKELFGY